MVETSNLVSSWPRASDVDNTASEISDSIDGVIEAKKSWWSEVSTDWHRIIFFHGRNIETTNANIRLLEFMLSDEPEHKTYNDIYLATHNNSLKSQIDVRGWEVDIRQRVNNSIDRLNSLLFWSWIAIKGFIKTDTGYRVDPHINLSQPTQISLANYRKLFNSSNFNNIEKGVIDTLRDIEIPVNILAERVAQDLGISSIEVLDYVTKDSPQEVAFCAKLKKYKFGLSYFWEHIRIIKHYKKMKK